MHVFMSAAREARPYALPDLIAGFETDLTDTQVAYGEVAIETVFVPRRGLSATRVDAATGEEATGRVRLVGRPTGKEYRDLPWWEVVLG